MGNGPAVSKMKTRSSMILLSKPGSDALMSIKEANWNPNFSPDKLTKRREQMGKDVELFLTAQDNYMEMFPGKISAIFTLAFELSLPLFLNIYLLYLIFRE